MAAARKPVPNYRMLLCYMRQIVYSTVLYTHIYDFCVSNPELKYGWETSASGLTNDLFQRIQIFTQNEKKVLI